MTVEKITSCNDHRQNDFKKRDLILNDCRQNGYRQNIF